MFDNAGWMIKHRLQCLPDLLIPSAGYSTALWLDWMFCLFMLESYFSSICQWTNTHWLFVQGRLSQRKMIYSVLLQLPILLTDSGWGEWEKVCAVGIYFRARAVERAERKEGAICFIIHFHKNASMFNSDYNLTCKLSRRHPQLFAVAEHPNPVVYLKIFSCYFNVHILLPTQPKRKHMAT